MLLVRLIAITIPVLFTAACGPSLPSDAEMITAFSDNKSAFEQVRDVVLRAEGIERVEEGETERLPLTPLQRQQVASLMDTAGVTLIRVSKSSNGNQWIEFAMHRSGFAFGGALKTISWANSKPEPPLLENLDDPTDRRGFVTKTWFRANRPLQDGWYLSLSKD